MATCGCSDEDRTAEIKEKVEPASWDCGPLYERYVTSSYPFNLFKQNERLRSQAEISSLNIYSLIQKCNS